ncbi:alkaline phosphatase family protein [Gammaproteobacteria bacterium]|nr:alkaline phosphatase family protein [Gammaproteobacteria bacterium]
MTINIRQHAAVLPLAVLALFLATPLSAAAPRSAPRLMLQITVDQLRADLPYRYFDRLGEGGLKYLISEGLVYRNAHHGHANTETIVGHATLSTGADPSVHGMVGNVWLDRASGHLKYNIEDERYPILSADAGVDAQSEVDPTQRAARSDGRSPSAILTSTVGDELMIHQGGKAKVFAVSVKDRGAVAMAGHTGKAFWFSKKSGEFITSRYYYDDYPNWVIDWNAQDLPRTAYSGREWTLLHDRDTYLFAEQDDRSYETSMPGFGRVFPHAYGNAYDKLFTTLLTLSPAGDELVLDFAKSLIIEEALGADDDPDYLSVSFSSTDYVGHVFGPSSLEAEDNLLRLDRALADLFAFVDQHVGLQNTVIAFSADHGGGEAPPYLAELGFETDYIVPDAFDTAAEIAAIKQKYAIKGRLIKTFFQPYLYLDHDAIDAAGADRRVVEQAVADVLSAFDGVSVALSSEALAQARVAKHPLTQAILNNYHPRRSGDIYIVFEPGRLIADFDGLTVASSHGSPWRYDSQVPLILVGAEIPSGEVFRSVSTTSLAPTLANLLHTKVPSGAFADPLVEAFASNGGGQ